MPYSVIEDIDILYEAAQSYPSCGKALELFFYNILGEIHSMAKLAYIRFKRVFSASSSFTFFISLASIPPYFLCQLYSVALLIP